MTKSTKFSSSRLRTVLVAALAVQLIGCPAANTPAGEGGSGGSGAEEAETTRLWIDTHAHPIGVSTTCLTEDCLAAAAETMDSYGVRKAILMHPPSPAGSADDELETDVREAAATDPDRFFYGAGGNTLNARLQQAPDSDTIPPALQQAFDDTAEGLIETGQVVVFGETAALHLSYEEGHAYEETPPNAPIFLRLADLAAGYDVPIDLHMDTAEETMATPTYFTEASPLNPSELPTNIAPFEELLDYNTSARIVWAHVGRDTTGDMTATLVGRLLEDHANFYIQLAPTYGPLGSSTAILDGTGTIRSDWLSLLQTYPDRAVLGSDLFLTGTEADATDLGKVQDFLQQLPEDLATQIGCTNPVAIYNLPSGC